MSMKQFQNFNRPWVTPLWSEIISDSAVTGLDLVFADADDAWDDRMLHLDWIDLSRERNKRLMRR